MSVLSHHRAEMFPRQFCHPGGGGLVGIELDGYPTLIFDCGERREDCGEIDGALAGGEMLVDAVGADVLQVDVGDVLRHGADHTGGVFSHAKQVADVAVHADDRIILEKGALEFQVLRGGFDEQAGFRLDGDDHIISPRQFEHALQSRGEALAGLGAGDGRADERAAGLNAHGLGVELVGQFQTGHGVGNPDIALALIILDPVWVIGVSQGEEGKGVDVADAHLQPVELAPKVLALAGVHRRGIGVRHIRHQLHAAISDCRDGLDRLGEGVLLECIG